VVTIGLLIVLAMIFILPFVFHPIERNLEYFLLAMGICATLISRTLSLELMIEIFENYLLYFITFAVLIAGFIFRVSVNKIRLFVNSVTMKIPLTIFIFLIIVVLGLVSSVITAIIAALVLVEIVNALPLTHDKKIKLTIIACFSIGLGATLTPIGEPLATIVVSALNADFLYLLRCVGIYIVPCIIALGVFGGCYIGRSNKAEDTKTGMTVIENIDTPEKESLKEVLIRAFKIFLFIIALELLGSGFKPLINNYVIHFDSRLLYWINMCSAVLDNATLAAAEISSKMSLQQIQAILMGLLLSGGMLIPGNIPNIIAAGKLNIKSREWAKFGAPLGLILLFIFFAVIFIF
jgi:predicted cation transporter